MPISLSLYANLIEQLVSINCATYFFQNYLIVKFSIFTIY